MDLTTLTIAELSAKLTAKDISAVDVANAFKKNIDARNESLNVFLEVFEDIDAQAIDADTRRAAGENHPLLGIPLGMKDNILIEGRIASAASKMLEHYTATYDATVTKKLKAAGAVFMGRTNMDEFAMGSSTENSAFGPTKNPVDETRVPGGTSGGSAAAVAARMVPGAIGTDTGGSVREPASFCGVVGFKPTYGAISRSGLIAMGSSLDQAGPLAHTAADTKLLFDAIRGKDPLDSTSIDATFYGAKTPGKKIGVPRALLTDGIDSDILEHFHKNLAALEAQGYDIVDIALPSASLALAVYYVIMPAEVSTNLSRFDGVRYGLSAKGTSLWEDYAKSRGAGFSAEVRRRIMLGTYVLSAGYYDAYFGKATVAREQLRKETSEVLERVDYIATPTAPVPAPKLGEKADPLSMYLMDVFTVTANITGNPAISVPMGTVAREGSALPVGIQFTAAHGNDDALFVVAQAVEQSTTA